jgi:acyl dehydratase
MRYWEDFAVGSSYDLGTKVVTEAEIIAFAKEFDPQPFHVDPSAAAKTEFGGLIASGWHTSVMFMRLYYDAILNDAANFAGVGIDELRLKAPVRPGDTLAGKTTVIASRPSESKPGLGVLGMQFELHNQRGELVWEAISWQLMHRRPES